MALNPFTATEQLKRAGTTARLLREASEMLSDLPSKFTCEEADEFQGMLACLCEFLDLRVDDFFPSPTTQEGWAQLKQECAERAKLPKEQQEELRTQIRGQTAADALTYILRSVGTL